MAISFVASTEGIRDGIGSASYTLSKPAGTTTDDLMIAVVSARGRDNAPLAPFTPTGWVSLGSFASGGSSRSAEAIFYRICQAGDSGTSSWSASLSQTCAISVIVSTYRGIDTSSPFIAYRFDYGPSFSTTTTQAVTNTDANAWRVAAWMSATGIAGETWSNYSPPDTERRDVSAFASPSGSTAALVDSNGVIGSTGSIQSSATRSSSAVDGQTFIAALRPAVTSVEYDSTLGDSEGITDSLSASTERVRSANSAEGLTDSLSAQAEYVRHAGDAEGVTDVLSASVARGLMLGSGAGLSDALKWQAEYVRAETDAVGLTDVLVARVNHVLSSATSAAVGLTDSLSATVVHTGTGYPSRRFHFTGVSLGWNLEIRKHSIVQYKNNKFQWRIDQ